MPEPSPDDHLTTTAQVRLVLVHSPIVGRDTWVPVAETLRARGCHVVLPRLTGDTAPPYWAAHVDSVIDSVGHVDEDSSPIVLILHSGAGQLADHLIDQLDRRGHQVEGVVFADAGLPTGGHSRLVQLRGEAPTFADELHATLTAGDRFPDWTDTQLRPLVPDGARRRRLLDGLKNLPAEYWAEPIPAVETPPHRRAVLLFSRGYAPTVAAADANNWHISDLKADNHFLPLAEEILVAEAILDLVDRLLDEVP